jgi:hypothetical protein
LVYTQKKEVRFFHGAPILLGNGEKIASPVFETGALIKRVGLSPTFPTIYVYEMSILWGLSMFLR